MRARQGKYADSYKFLRDHFGEKIDKDQVSWGEVQTALTALKHPKEQDMIFAGIVGTMVAIEREKSRNNPQSRVQNHTHQREEAQNDGRHTGAKRSVDSESERESNKRKAEISAKTSELERDRKAILKIDEDIRRLEGELNQARVDKNRVSSRITLLENELQSLQQGVDRSKGGAIYLTKGDSASPMQPAPEFRVKHADAAEGRIQSGAARGTQGSSKPAVRDQSSAFGNAVFDAVMQGWREHHPRSTKPTGPSSSGVRAEGGSSLVTGNGSSKWPGITNMRGGWLNNICWLSSGVKFLIAVFDLNDSTMVNNGEWKDLLMRLTVSLRIQATVEVTQWRPFQIFYDALPKLGLKIRSGMSNDAAEMLVPIVAQLLKNPPVNSEMRTRHYNDGTQTVKVVPVVAPVIPVDLSDPTSPEHMTIGQVFSPTKYTPPKNQKYDYSVSVSSEIVIGTKVKRLFFNIKRDPVDLSDEGRRRGTQMVPKLIPIRLDEYVDLLDENQKPVQFRLLGFIYRPNENHYCAVLRDGDVWSDHNDSVVTKLEKGLDTGGQRSFYENRTTFLAYERV